MKFRRKIRDSFKLFSFFLKMSLYFIKYKFKKIKRIAMDICTPRNLYVYIFSSQFLRAEVGPIRAFSPHCVCTCCGMLRKVH